MSGRRPPARHFHLPALLACAACVHAGVLREEHPRPRRIDLPGVDVTEAAAFFSAWAATTFEVRVGLHARMTIVSDAPITPDEAGPAFIAALEARGFRTERHGDSVTVSSGAAGSSSHDVETHLIRVQGADVGAELFRKHLSGTSARVGAIGTKLLVLSGDTALFAPDALLGAAIDIIEEAHPVPRPAPVSGPPRVPYHPGEGITRTGEGTWSVTREAFESALEHMDQWAMQGRVVPAFNDENRATGFKIFSIQPGSLYEVAGFQNGDVIRRINGVDITSPEKALEAYQSIRQVGRLEIEFDRAGAPMKYEYIVSK